MNEQNIGPEKLQNQQAVPAVGQTFYQPENPQGDQPAYEGYDLTHAAVAPPMIEKHDENEQSVKWEASEYIHHDKGAAWIACLSGVALILVGIAIWLQVWTFAFLIVVMAVAMGVFAFRPPRVLHYRLDGQGLDIDGHFYSFADFRAFGVISEGAFYTVMLLPSKRFMPAVNVFFAEQDGEKIIDILGVRLPMEQLRIDFVDRLMRRLRF